MLVIKRIPVSNEIDERLVKKLQELKKTQRKPIGQTIEDALNMYFDKIESEE